MYIIRPLGKLCPGLYLCVMVAHFTSSRCFQNGTGILKGVTTYSQDNNPVPGIKVYKNSGQHTNDSFPNSFHCTSCNKDYRES